MNLLIRQLRWQGTDTCVAEIFDTVTQQSAETTFRLIRSPAGIGAVPDIDALRTTEATADDLRSLVRLVVAFCRAAQGENWRSL